MQQLIEQNIGLIVVAALPGIWRLGRGRRLLVPASWPRRTGSLLALVIGATSAWVLLQMVVSVSPKLGAISQLNAAVGSTVPDVAFRLVADDDEQRLRQYADIGGMQSLQPYL